MNQITIYSATGCTRCRIVKNFMEEKGINYVDKDMKAEGKGDFQKFYAENRKAIYRGEQGVEFPIITDGTVIKQGIGASLAYLQSGDKLDGFFSVGSLHQEWVDGIHVSGGKPESGEEFLAVLRYLKKNNMKLQIDCNGRNSRILKQIQAENLASVIIMEVIGMPELCREVYGPDISAEEVVQSIQTAINIPEYRFQATVVPIRQNGAVRYLTPDEVAESAKLLENLTKSNKRPFLIRLFPLQEKSENKLGIEPLSANDLLAYRSRSRKYQVLTEIEKA